MNKHNAKTCKGLLAAGLCGLGLWAGSAAAHNQGPGHQARELDRRGDRIEQRLDRKGDRIAHRLLHRADRLRAQGRYAEARRLAREARRIDRRLDRKGERINRQLDRRAAQLHHQWRQEHRYGRNDHHDYRPRAPRHHDTGVTLALDLGRWVFRP